MQKIVWGAHARAWGGVACGFGCEPAVSAMQQSGCCELGQPGSACVHDSLLLIFLSPHTSPPRIAHCVRSRRISRSCQPKARPILSAGVWSDHGFGLAMASFHLVPRAGADFRATLVSLQLNFEFADEILEALVKAKLKNLEEFRYFFESEAEIGVWVQRLNLGDVQGVQTARLRRTWAAVKVFFQHADAGRTKVGESDLDDLLDDTSLRDMKQQFWRRYRTRFPPELYPSDATLSRVTRELNKRLLCVFSVWKVKSLQFQLVTTSKKRRLGDGLFTEETEQEESVPRDWENYLDRLHILLTA